MKACTLADNTTSSASAARSACMTENVSRALAAVSALRAGKKTERQTPRHHGECSHSNDPMPGHGIRCPGLKPGSFFDGPLFVCIRYDWHSFPTFLLGLKLHFVRFRTAAAGSVHQAKQRWHEKQSCNRGKHETADHRAAERRILLAAFPQSQRHRHHADDHG